MKDNTLPPKQGVAVEFKNVADHSPALIWMAGTDGLCNWFNKGWLEFTGRTIEQEMGNGWTEGVHPEDFEPCVKEYTQHFEAREHFLIEYRLRRHDGEYRWILDSGTPRFDEDKLFQGYNGVCFDITERKQVEEELRIAAVSFEAQQGMLVTDTDKRIIRANQAVSQLLGYSTDELINQTPALFSSERHDTDFYKAMWKDIATAGYWHGEIWNRHKNGPLVPLLLTITSVKNETQKTTHYVSCYTDISQRVKDESQLHDLAFYDPLTGLANRRLLLDRLSVSFSKSSRSKNYGALLFIDIDHFKELNDRHGHVQGDVMLEKVAGRLMASMRDGDTVARFGGDEFVVLLEDISDNYDKARKLTFDIAEKLRISINTPYTLHSKSTFEWLISPSIGATLFLSHEKPVATVLEEADNAMYTAKEAGRNTVKMFEENINL